MDNKGVLVCGEIVEGKLAPVTIELLGAGRKLASDLGEELSILLMGSQAGALARKQSPTAPTMYTLPKMLNWTRIILTRILR